MATLLSHTGLVLFLVAAAVTSRLGDEQGLVVAEGDSLTVQPIGTPGLLLVRTWASRRRASTPASRPTSRPTSRSTRTASRWPTRRSGSTTRCPSAATPSTRTASGRRPTSSIRDQAGKPLWTGPISMTDQAAGFPRGGRGPGPRRRPPAAPPAGERRDGAPAGVAVPLGRDEPRRDAQRARPGAGRAGPRRGGDARGHRLLRRAAGFSDYTLLIAKKDPGQGIVWVAFLSLIVGIVISFWLPRRRVWGRLDGDGRLSLVMRADRYVDAGREFGRLLDDLVAARRAGPPGGTPASSEIRLTPKPSPRGRPRSEPRGAWESVAAPSRTWSRNIAGGMAGDTPGTGQTRVECPCHPRLQRFVDGPAGTRARFHPPAPATSSCKLRRDRGSSRHSGGSSCPARRRDCLRPRPSHSPLPVATRTRQPRDRTAATPAGARFRETHRSVRDRATGASR